MVADLTVVVTAIMSVVSYLQNIGASMNGPDFDLPDQARQIFQYVSKFLDAILRSIPSLPAFDGRAQLALMAFVIPFLVTVVFIFVVTPSGQVILHLTDILVVAVTSMMAAGAFLIEWTTAGQVSIVAGVIYICIRGVMAFLKRPRSDWLYEDLADQVCRYYMQDRGD
jgi:hypothetical protein